MDAEYLRNTVGSCLSECLAEVCMKRPADPIEYMAHWLYKHVDNVNARNQEIADQEELARQEQEYREMQEALERQRLEQEMIAQEEEDRRKAAEEEAAAQAAAALSTLTEGDEPPGGAADGDEVEGEDDGVEGDESGTGRASNLGGITTVAEADEEEEEVRAGGSPIDGVVTPSESLAGLGGSVVGEEEGAAEGEGDDDGEGPSRCPWARGPDGSRRPEEGD